MNATPVTGLMSFKVVGTDKHESVDEGRTKGACYTGCLSGTNTGATMGSGWSNTLRFSPCCATLHLRFADLPGARVNTLPLGDFVLGDQVANE